MAGPEVGEDDDAGDGGVGAPEGSEGVALEDHDGEENDEICCAEDDHHSDFREEEGAAGGDDVENGDRGVVGGWIDVDDAVSLHVDLELIGCERPQNIESGAASDDEEGEHAFAGFGGGFEEVDAEREKEGEESLGVEHEGGAHVVGDFGGEDAVEAEPDEAFDELVDGE